MAKADHIFVSHGIYTHHGIDCGDGSVVHLSRASGEIGRIDIDQFLSRRSLRVQLWAAADDPEVVLQRATSRLGERGYNLFSNNCEHFASWCKTGVARSSQVSRVEQRVAAVGGKQLAARLITHAAVKLGGKGLARSASPALLIADAAQLGTEVLLVQRGVDARQAQLAGAGVGVAGSAAIGAMVGGPVGSCIAVGVWAASERIARWSKRPSLAS